MILPSRSWDVQKIRDSFSGGEADLILAIPLANGSSPDRRCGHFDSKGQYSVKSGYKLAYAISRSASTSSSGNKFKSFWSRFGAYAFHVKSLFSCGVRA